MLELAWMVAMQTKPRIDSMLKYLNYVGTCESKLKAIWSHEYIYTEHSDATAVTISDILTTWNQFLASLKIALDRFLIWYLAQYGIICHTRTIMQGTKSSRPTTLCTDVKALPVGSSDICHDVISSQVFQFSECNQYVFNPVFLNNWILSMSFMCVVISLVIRKHLKFE